MEFHAKIEAVDEHPEMLLAAFSPELKNPKADRSGYGVSRQGNRVVLDFSANDAVAMRAAADSIIKLLIVYEKTGKVK